MRQVRVVPALAWPVCPIGPPIGLGVWHSVAYYRRLTITLTPEQIRWLEAEVAAGRFASIDDGARAAVAELLADDWPVEDHAVTNADILADDMAWAKPLVDEAIAEIERGEGIPYEQVKAELDAFLKSIGQ